MVASVRAWRLVIGIGLCWPRQLVDWVRKR
jgi:hypothetical protein